MTLPRWNSQPVSPSFEALVKAGNFSSWCTFDASVDFYTALALGLLLHSYPLYEEFSTYMERIWKPLMEPLKSIEEHYLSELGEKRFWDERYWAEIRNQFQIMCASVFEKTDPPKTNVAERISSNCPLNFLDVDNISALLKHFKACLCLYQFIEGHLRTTEYCSKNSGEIALVIFMMEEKGKLYLLIPCGFQWQQITEANSLNYIKLKSCGPQLPELDLGYVVISDYQRPSAESEYAVIIKSLVAMVEQTSKILAKSTGKLDEELRDDQEELRNIKKEVQRVMAMHPQLNCSLEFPNLTRVLELPVILKKQPRPPHTIMTCGQYPEEGELIPTHDHHFHKECLYVYLKQISSNDSLELTCPCCDRGLPGLLLEHFPDLRGQFFEKKQIFMVNSSAEIDMCEACQSRRLAGLHLNHGCRLCKSCLDRCWQSSSCTWCGIALIPQEIETARTFYSTYYEY